MEYRTLGKSAVKATRVTFGAWAIGGWMWGGADRKDALNAIKAAYDNGVTSFDTAPAYGQGLSEEITGEALSGIPRDKVQILTKYGLRWDVSKGEFYFKSRDNHGNDIDMYKFASKEGIMHECEASLKRLKTDYIDLYQIHWPDRTTLVSETMEAMQILLEQGKIRAAGVCNYSAELMKEALKYVDLASNQVPYSMLKRDIEKEVVPMAVQNNMSIIAYSPLQRGLLTGKIKPGQDYNKGDTRKDSAFYSDANVNSINNFLEKLKPLAAEKNATLGQLVIRWTIEQPGITIALVGARTPEQAIENAGSVNITLSQTELDFINQELGKLKLVP